MRGPAILGCNSLNQNKADNWMQTPSTLISPVLIHYEQMNYADTTLKQNFDQRIEGNNY